MRSPTRSVVGWGEQSELTAVTGRPVLVVGGGSAGSKAAYWLALHYMSVTVVERAVGDRSSELRLRITELVLGITGSARSSRLRGPK